MDSTDPIESMRQVNRHQRRYYEHASGHATSQANNAFTNAYRRLRRRVRAVYDEIDLAGEVAHLHREWCPDLSDARVLDLGAGTGHTLSPWLARNANTYVALDLSQSSLDILREKVQDAQGVTLRQGDFLDPESFEGLPDRYEVVFARSVLHHFEHFTAFLDLLHSRMVPDGVLLSHDPLQTWGPYRIFRRLYQFVQTDAAWEHPFTRDSLQSLRRYFHVERVQGLMGHSKWGMVVGLVLPELGRRIAQRGHERDMEEATSLDRTRHCLQVCLRLRRRGS